MYNDDEVKEAFLAALQDSKELLLTKGSQDAIKGVMENVFEIEEYDKYGENVHYIQEQNLIKAIFVSYGLAIDRMVSLFTKMIDDGVIVANYTNIRKKLHEEGIKLSSGRSIKINWRVRQGNTAIVEGIAHALKAEVVPEQEYICQTFGKHEWLAFCP